MAPRPPNDTGTGGGDLSGFVAALQRALCLGAVALYGSRGRGDHFPDSDYDFVVVSSSFDGLNPLRRREKPYEAWAATGPGRGAGYIIAVPGGWKMAERPAAEEPEDR